MSLHRNQAKGPRLDRGFKPEKFAAEEERLGQRRMLKTCLLTTGHEFEIDYNFLFCNMPI